MILGKSLHLEVKLGDRKLRFISHFSDCPAAATSSGKNIMSFYKEL